MSRLQVLPTGSAFARPARWAALAAGALPALAFPAPNAEWLAWAGLVPGLLLFRGAPSPREAAARGWWFGTGFMLAAHYWLAPNIGPGLPLAAAVFGSLWTGVALSCAILLRSPVTVPRALAALLTVPSWWLAVEWIRSWQGFGGPWALLGASQWRHPAVLALASVGGVWLVSFALVAANTGLTILAAGGGTRVRLLGLAGAAAAAGAGPLAYALAPAPPADGRVRVALVQPGLIRSAALRAAASERASAGLTREKVDLVVWGESSVAYDLPRDRPLLSRIEALSAADGAQILVNQDSYQGAAKSKTAILIGPHGIAGTYTKSRLVPFGEYIPLRGELGWLAAISRAAPVNMAAGPGARVLGARRPPAGACRSACSSASSPRSPTCRARTRSTAPGCWSTRPPMRRSSRAGSRPSTPRSARCAPPKTGRPVAQAALTGDSVAFDARGRLIAALPLPRHGVLVAGLALPPASSLTIFDRIGDVAPWTAIGIAVLSAFATLVVYRHPHRPAEILLEGNHRPGSSVSVAETSRGLDPPSRGCGQVSRDPSGAT